MNENTYRMWEDKSRSCPKIYDIYRLSRFYDVSVDYILSGDTDSFDFTGKVAENNYNKNDGNSFFGLENYEKLLLMNVRSLSLEQKQTLNDFIFKLTNEEK